MLEPLANGPTTATAIVLAGGSGIRFGAEVNKVLVPIGGRPVLGYSLATFEEHSRIDAIVIVARAGDEAAIDTIVSAVGARKVASIVPGGETRQGSEWAGLQAAAQLGFSEATVMIHDAARPFMTAGLIDRLLDDASPGGTIPTVAMGVPLVDPDGRPVPADDLRRVQTPQSFPLDLLLEIYPRAESDGFSGVDTAETVQHYGAGPTRWVEGDQRNIKVTHPDDRAHAEALASSFGDSTWH